VTFEKVEVKPVNTEATSGLSMQEAMQKMSVSEKGEVKQMVASIDQRSGGDHGALKADDETHVPTKPALDIDTEAKRAHRKFTKQASFSDQELSDNEEVFIDF